MKNGLTWLILVVTAVATGCASRGGQQPYPEAMKSCYERDKRETSQLAAITQRLLGADVGKTLQEHSDCDSEEAGGAWITYDLDRKASPKQSLKKFYSDGWVNVPLPIESCGATCIAGVKKMIQGRHILATIEDFPDSRDLVVVFEE
ncbi:hypothetical protein [Nonomuraea endophytica]|uniref:Lipoprotein n=1 Tax=Nonomuraea endophytica TaxID=714136 RepID=A0A7W8A097_9ACTN|nr:hypothetical protein [Nonomuraea endophytica]MBB5077069.1 hypothetical protein [Nonomuraea endophytica]